MIMEYAIGVVLGFAVCGLGTIVGFDRDRSFYPVVMIVIAFYYVLFAVAGGDGHAVGVEMAIAAAFVCLALIGFRTSLWLVAAALLGHATLDLVHGNAVANAGVPRWWPMFCASIDAFIAFYLAARLGFKRIDAHDPLSFDSCIRASIETELQAAQAAERCSEPLVAFRHLERAHVLGQRSTAHHMRVHMQMLAWGLRRRNSREVIGQLARIAGAAAKTWLGLIPRGNTGGSNVSAFSPMPIPDDLIKLIDAASARRQSCSLEPR